LALAVIRFGGRNATTAKPRRYRLKREYPNDSTGKGSSPPSLEAKV
jgi:hypothetical protein